MWPPILTGNPLCYFDTIHIPNEEAGELDPFFIGKYFLQLANEWDLFDGDKNHHKIEFNLSITKPRLTNGWKELREFYNWPATKTLGFFYYGQNTFMMIASNGDNTNNPYFFPELHTMSTRIEQYRYFPQMINQCINNVPELIMSHDLSSFLSTATYEELELCGPLENIVTCQIILNAENGMPIKLGRGWETFCQANNLSPGNHLEFVCDGLRKSNIIIVKRH